MKKYTLLALVLLAFPIGAHAITTGPLTSLPVNHPVALLALVLVLGVSGFVILRRRPAAASLLLVGVACLALWQGPALKAQLLASFTNPAGETLPIPVEQIESGGDIAGFEPADFTNASGEPLTIRSIELPDFDTCFPGGIPGALLPPGAADPSPPPACAVDRTLATGATCRVDVDSHCRAEAAAAVTLTAVGPTSGTTSGGTGFTLTGTNLAGATAVSFDGVAATSVNVVNSTTVTGVTPAHAVGVVDVVVSTPGGDATLANGFTYVATAVGQASGGGTIACLNGGLNNLIAATADNATAIEWGGVGTAIGAGAQSNTDGASNTTAIVTMLGNNSGTPYAAQMCNNYEVDSQGNTPCQAGNTCYNDWFVPAGNNITAAGQHNCLYTNRVAIGGFANEFYWSSTESSGTPEDDAWAQYMGVGTQVIVFKPIEYRLRCVRAFTP